MNKLARDEKGYALILVLILLLLGSLLIPPLLGYMATGLKTGLVYEKKTNELYTADAGIEDGLWRIKYDFMGVDYNPYDFETAWPYKTEAINGMAANFTIKNVWFPSDVTLESVGLTPDTAREMIKSEKLVVAGTSGAIPGNPYSIKIDFTPDAGDNLTVKSLGVWLPQGFEYVADSCSLQDDGPTVYNPDSTTVSEAPGGQTVLWKYNPPNYPLFTDFPDVDPEEIPMTANFTFRYMPPAEHPNWLPLAIAWITTGMDPGSFGYPNTNDVPVSWDIDSRFYKIVSKASDTEVEAYSSKSELRQMGDAMSGDYVAIGNSLLADDNHDNFRETWHNPSSFTLNSVPSDADVAYAYLYWSGWRNEASKQYLINDSCTNMNTYWTYGSPTVWSVFSNEYNGHYNSGGTDARLLTMKTQNLSHSPPYPMGSIALTWEQATGKLILTDTCDNLNNWTNGTAWSVSSVSGDNKFRGRSSLPAGDANRLLTLNSGLVNLAGRVPGTVKVSWDMSSSGTLGSGDGLDIAFYNGSSWESNIQIFRGSPMPSSYTCTIPDTCLNSGFKMRFELFGFGSSKYLYLDNILIQTTVGLSASDGLDYALSGDGGANWSDYIEALRGEPGGSLTQYICYLPSDYFTGSFKLKFKLIGCNEPGKKVRLDNIKIIYMPIDTEITFKIGNDQVYFNGSEPADGLSLLTAGRSYAMLNTMWGAPEGFSYACVRDVSALVKKYPVVQGEEHHTGNALYTVGGVSADTGSNFSFAGWSLIVVYACPETAGHYIYIRDDDFAFHPGTGGNLDWDEAGEPGGVITNFVVPNPITDKDGNVIETLAARLTCFVVEGDDFGTSSVRITGEQSGNSMELWNPASPYPDVFNGKSYPGTFNEGVDIDTFEVKWTDGILTPKDNKLQVDLYSLNDAWNLIYIILSVRSETVTSGAINYLISG